MEEWHFAGKNQLPGLTVNWTLVKNGLTAFYIKIVKLHCIVKSFNAAVIGITGIKLHDAVFNFEVEVATV